MEVDRTKRVKEARDEAKKEIDDYRKSKDDEFKKFESEVRSSISLILWFTLDSIIGAGLAFKP